MKNEITIKILDQEINLEEARQLYFKLHKLFGQRDSTPMPYPVNPVQPWYPDPVYPTYPTITCSHKNSNLL